MRLLSRRDDECISHDFPLAKPLRQHIENISIPNRYAGDQQIDRIFGQQGFGVSEGDGKGHGRTDHDWLNQAVEQFRI